MPENLGFITETALAGDYAYLARSGDDPGIVILDISDLENPQVVSRTDVGGGHTWRAMISTSGDYAYIANERHVFSYDVSDPRNPVSLGDWYSNIRIWDSTADEDYLYLAVGMEGISCVERFASVILHERCGWGMEREIVSPDGDKQGRKVFVKLFCHPGEHPFVGNAHGVNNIGLNLIYKFIEMHSSTRDGEWPQPMPDAHP